MKEKIKIILYIIIFIVLILLTNRLLNKDKIYEVETETDSGVKNYTEVFEDTFESEVLKSTQTVLVDFYADWCGPCKSLSPILEEVAKENNDVKLVKVNVDENGNLAERYEAYYIPTLVVIKDGVEVNRSVGLITKEEVLDLIK